MKMRGISRDSSLKGETIATITDEIMQLYELYGNSDYDGEPVSQASHMI